MGTRPGLSVLWVVASVATTPMIFAVDSQAAPDDPIRAEFLAPYLRKHPGARKKLEQLYDECVRARMLPDTMERLMEMELEIEGSAKPANWNAEVEQLLAPFIKRAPGLEAQIRGAFSQAIGLDRDMASILRTLEEVVRDYSVEDAAKFDSKLREQVMNHIQSDDYDFEFFKSVFVRLPSLHIPMDLQRAWVDRLAKYPGRPFPDLSPTPTKGMPHLLYFLASRLHDAQAGSHGNEERARLLAEIHDNPLTGYLAAKGVMTRQYYLPNQIYADQALIVLRWLSPESRKEAIEATMTYAVAHPSSPRDPDDAFPDPLFEHFFSKGEELGAGIDDWVVTGLASHLSLDYSRDTSVYKRGNPFEGARSPDIPEKSGVSPFIIASIPYTSEKGQLRILKGLMKDYTQRDFALDILNHLNFTYFENAEFRDAYLVAITEIPYSSYGSMGSDAFIEHLKTLPAELKSQLIDGVLALGVSGKIPSMEFSRRFLSEFTFGENEDRAGQWAMELLTSPKFPYWITRDVPKIMSLLSNPQQEKLLGKILDSPDLAEYLIPILTFAREPVQKELSGRILQADGKPLSKEILPNFLKLLKESPAFTPEHLWPSLTESGSIEIRKFALEQCASSIRQGQSWGTDAVTRAISNPKYPLSFRRELASVSGTAGQVRGACMLRAMKTWLYVAGVTSAKR